MIYPDAIWRPTGKHGYGSDDTHLRQGMVFHSMEGSLAGAFGRMDIPLDASNPYTQASWTFSVGKDGTVYQHADTDDITWTNGSYEANKRFWGVENEGRAGEPLTEPQYQGLLGLVRWIYPAHGLGFVRQQTAWEHNEMGRFGSAATACPSGRIPWERLLTDFNMEDDMTPEEHQRLVNTENAVARLEAASARNEQGREDIKAMLQELSAMIEAHDGSGSHSH